MPALNEALKSVALQAIPYKEAIFINANIDNTVIKEDYGEIEQNNGISKSTEFTFQFESVESWIDLSRSYCEFTVQIEKEKPTDPDINYKVNMHRNLQ